MVTLGSKRIHVVLTDSRGDGVDTRIVKLNKSGECMDLRVYKGATFDHLVEIAEGYLPKHLFDVVYIAGGVTNITHKDRHSKKISYRWGSSDALKLHLVNKLKKADERLQKLFPASRVVFCPLIGCELARIVNEHETSQEDQDAVTEAVWEFNTNVFKINAKRGTVSPALHHQVHRFCKGKKKTYYEHLGDGLHLSDFLKDKWAANFVKSMAHN